MNSISDLLGNPNKIDAAFDLAISKSQEQGAKHSSPELAQSAASFRAVDIAAAQGIGKEGHSL